MKQQTVKTIREILRFFILRPTGEATASEINAAVCKNLRIVRKANINNHQRVVREALMTLIDRGVLVAHQITDDENDSGGQITSKPKFTLTVAAEDFLTDPLAHSSLLPYGTAADSATIADLMRHFNVFPYTQATATTQETPVPETTNNPETTATATPDVQAVIDAIRAASSEWPNKNTPADLLGGLRAFHQQNGFTPHDWRHTQPASAAKLGWDQNHSREYKAAAEFLKARNLAVAAENRQHTGPHPPRPYGLRLTELGMAVANAGNFVDDRPARVPPTNSKKERPMLRNDKNNSEERVSLSREELERLLENTAHAAVERYVAQTGGAPAEVEAEEERPMYYTEIGTMSRILTRAAPALIDTFSAAIDGPEKTTGPRATVINSRGLYLTLTELEKMIAGLKGYVSECIKGDEYVDLTLMRAYAEDFSEAAAKLDKNPRLPLLATQIVAKAFLAGSQSVQRYRYARRAPTATE